jgi:hypothetical protein
MGLVEFAHLRILRRQPYETETAEPIPVSRELDAGRDPIDPETLKEWNEGQWFSVEDHDQGTLRLQLVFKADAEQQLLFTNMAGIKVLQLTFSDFSYMLRQKQVTPLYSGASFSTCLAGAAGITSAETLEALVETDEEATAQEPLQPGAEPVAEELVKQYHENTERDRQAGESKEEELPAAEAENDNGEGITPERGFLADQVEAMRAEQGYVPETLEQPDRDIDLPMGAWLGFHDGEMPLMARLAVHDPEEDHFIFVNRKGIKMRQLTKRELLGLIDAGLVDILQASSNFREAVTEVRKKLDD